MTFSLAVYLAAFLFSMFVAGALIGATRTYPFRLTRAKLNPILQPGRYPWTTKAVFNPSAIALAGRTHLLYRAVGNDGVSRLGYASSSDGITLDVQSAKPAFAVDGIQAIPKDVLQGAPVVSSSGSTSGGCEDPRMVHIDRRIYVTFNLYNGWDSIRTAVISIDETDFIQNNFDTWRGPHLLSRAGQIHKNWILFPEKIDGKFAILHSLYGETEDRVRVEYADDIETFTPDKNLVSHDPLAMASNQIAWHARMKSAGPPPIKTSRGWLVLYHAMSRKEPSRYKLGAMLLDLSDPAKVLYRAPAPLLFPDMPYENRNKPGVVYACGAVVRDGVLSVYYGGGDTVVCMASIRLDSLLRALTHGIKPKHKSAPEQLPPLFSRAPSNPILTPQGGGFESRAVFNPAAIDLKGTVHLLYRAMDDAHTSTIGLARSLDGMTISEQLLMPIYTPRAEFEKKSGDSTSNSGCEDPRIVQIENRLYLTYTAYDGVHPPAGALSSIPVDDFMAERFDAWTTPVILTPEGVDDKDFLLLPEKVQGKFVLYHRINNQLCADVVSEVTSGKRVSRCIEILSPRPGMWDSEKVGAAAPPIKTSRGWLMIYHGISSDHVYRLGMALLDFDGTTLLARSDDAILEPMMDYEKEGNVPNVVFSCGAVVRGDTVFLYYGAADQVIGVATASLSRMLDALS